MLAAHDVRPRWPAQRAQTPDAASLGVQNANVGGYQARGFVEVLAASQSVVSKKWFQGTADAVRQYLWLFDNAVRDGVEDFLILSGEYGTAAWTRVLGPARFDLSDVLRSTVSRVTWDVRPWVTAETRACTTECRGEISCVPSSDKPRSGMQGGVPALVPIVAAGDLHAC